MQICGAYLAARQVELDLFLVVESVVFVVFMRALVLIVIQIRAILAANLLPTFSFSFSVPFIVLICYFALGLLVAFLRIKP